MKERRTTNRFPYRYAVAYDTGRDQQAGVVLDVSLGGIRLYCPSRLEPGSRVGLAPLTDGAEEVECTVAWYRPGRDTLRRAQAGLEFVEPAHTWTGSLLGRVETRPERLLQRRCSVRVATGLKVRVRQIGTDYTVSADVCELSQGGARLRCQALWAPDMRLDLEFERIWALSQVVSTRFGEGDWLYSVRFLEMSSGSADRLEALVGSVLAFV